MKLVSSRRLLAGLIIGVATTAQAQQFSTTPEPGLWRTEVQSEINGQDMIAAMREVQAALLADMPPEQRALAEAFMEDEMPGVEMECLSPEDLDGMGDMNHLIGEMRAEMPGCDLNIDETGRDHLVFSGSCRNHEGFTGDIGGEVRMVSAREMRQVFEGSGEYEMGEGGMPGLGELDGKVTMKNTVVSRWISEDCQY